MKPLQQRQIEFKHILWEAIGKTFDVYSKEFIIEFCEYWFEMNHNGRKMRFEKETTYDVERRLGRFKRNKENWNTPKEKRQTLPPYLNKALWQKLDHEKMLEYKTKLQNLGWQYCKSQSGNSWVSPDNKRTWL